MDTLPATENEDHGDHTDSYDMFTEEDQLTSSESPRISVFVSNLPSDLNTQKNSKRPSSRSHHHRALSNPFASPHAEDNSNESHSKGLRHRKSASMAFSDIVEATPKPGPLSSGNTPDGMTITPAATRSMGNVRDQERLFTLQSELKQCIGSDSTLILSQFLDIMTKIAPHIPSDAAINMFNQMDASNDGQIPSSLLLINGFLPRLILLFKREGSDRRDAQTFSVHDSSHSQHSAFTTLDLEDSTSDYDGLSTAELIRKLKAQRQEMQRLREWRRNVGQPAHEKVAELEQTLAVYEAERDQKVDEIQSFRLRLSVMDDMQDQLRRHKSASHSLLQEKDTLLVAMEESEQRQQHQQRKYAEAIREAMKYKTLVAELEGINGKYSARNETLAQRLSALQRDYDAQERLLHQYDEDMQRVTADLQRLPESMSMDGTPDGDKLLTMEDKPSLSGLEQEPETQRIRNSSISLSMRRRKMTLKIGTGVKSVDSEDEEDALTLEADIEKRQRGMTMGQHTKRASGTSLHNIFSDESLNSSPVFLVNNADAPLQYNITPAISPGNVSQARTRKGSTTSSQSTLTVKNQSEPMLAFMPYDRGSGDMRKQIEEELRVDYELKLKQKEIETAIRLNKSKEEIIEQYRKLQEKQQSEITALKSQLSEQREVAMHHKMNRISVEDDDDGMAYMVEQGTTSLSSTITDHVNSDDEKQVYDQNFAVQEESLDSDDDEYPLLASHKGQDKLVQIQEHSPLESDELDGDQSAPPTVRKTMWDKSPCFSCWNVLSGRGI